MPPLIISLLLILSILVPLSSPAEISSQFLYPNSTFNPFNFVDNAGTFLSSPTHNFSARFSNPGRQQTRYYLTLFHSTSNSIVWSANPDVPVPASATLSLSTLSLSLSFPNGTLAWSTPPLPSPIHSLQLLDSGNLRLLDSSNYSLWQSFEHPTDTLLPGQRLLAGSSLSSSVSASDLSDSGHRLLVTSDDVVLRWRGSQQYWSLSLDPKSIRDSSNTPAAYLQINDTALYLLDAGNRIISQLGLPLPAGPRVGKLGYDGQFRVLRFGSTNNQDAVFSAPTDPCDLPLSCGAVGLCPAGGTCGCPDSFKAGNSGGCSPVDGSALASPSTCNESSPVSYLSLGNAASYFANKFSSPIKGNDFSSCLDSCSKNCSCLAFFYRNSSLACYLVHDQLGSLATGHSDTFAGYVKIMKSPPPPSQTSPNPGKTSSSTNVVPILLPLIAAILLLVVLFLVGVRWWRKKIKERGLAVRPKSPLKAVKAGHPSSPRDDGFSDSEEVLIPGLPTRFALTELALATNEFDTLIGSGGFGSVYKGELPDKSLIAVKKITNIGIQGKREFCTEIAVIGKIHHVNLVRLRGYCAQGSNRMLVYEYMNRGSLDRPLFGQGPALEWQERLEIAIGAARGLAYLHSGCDQKILHCDIKPENILLADHGQVKIADFGMAKLMTPEQSGLFTTMRGTRGYLAPEWLTNAAISDKTDVYSYGMVLLEIVRGRKNRYSPSGASEFSGASGSSAEYFPMVAVERHAEQRWLELADPRMQGRVTEAELTRVVKVALCCLHEEPWMRPGMAAVVGMLEGTMAVWEPKVEGLKFLRLYGGAPGGAGADAGAGGGVYPGSESSSASASLLTFISSQEVSGPR